MAQEWVTGGDQMLKTVLLYIQFGAGGLLGVMLVLTLLRRYRNRPLAVARRAVRGVADTGEVRLTGHRPAGWSIESPDGFFYYPVGESGPADFTELRSRGFDRSAEGAGVAAVHIRQRLDPSPNDSWRGVVGSQTIGPEGNERLEQLLSAVSGDRSLQGLLASLPYKSAFVGWRVEGFSSWRADLTLAGVTVVRTGVTRWLLPATMLWSDDDWKLLVGEDPSGQAPAIVTDFGRLDVSFLDCFDLN